MHTAMTGPGPMKQIYYTQCPMGYGLGASNGFQVKRLSEGYPSGDFRHLGMRAFLTGSRTLAPPALRYRRDGEVAEVAWLTPRTQEYETERGLWGRPGGHFAHGLRLDARELAALANWPAGLHGRPFWRRSDPEPTRGRPPDPVGLGPQDLIVPPTLRDAAGLTPFDPDLLARLLTALAAVVREGRTLFLIDEAQRLPARIALLTFAFPEPMRPALTFSTYHDRPEELPGFRIQGIVPAARPNRPALLGLGLVADLGAGTIEPRVEKPAAWATTLALWLVRHDAAGNEAAWTKTNARARRIWERQPPEDHWSDAWLDGLIGYHRATLHPELPAVAEDWDGLTRLTSWARDAGLAGKWVQVRGPRWWIDAAAGPRCPEGRAALLALGGLSETWRFPPAYKEAHPGAPLPMTWRCDDPAASWGEAVALWFGESDPGDRFAAIASILAAAPPASRKAFLSGVVKALPAPVAAEVVGRLKVEETFDQSLLLPLDAQMAASRLLDRPQETAALHDVLLRASAAAPEALVDVLDVLTVVADGRPGAIRALAVPLALIFHEADRLGRSEALVWALQQGDSAREWLGPYLQGAFALPENQEEWRRIRQRTPDELHPLLARAVLSVAGAEGRFDEAFLWGIEEVLVPLKKAERRRDPDLLRAYLDRIPGDVTLYKKLFSRGEKKPGLQQWLDETRADDLRAAVPRITPEQNARLVRCPAFEEMLNRQDARALREIVLPINGRDEQPWLIVLPIAGRDERPWLMRLLLMKLGSSSSAAVEVCLTACRRAWGEEAFQTGAPGLAGLALPVAAALLPPKPVGGSSSEPPPSPERWFDHLRRALDALGVVATPDLRFDRHSLAAEIVAATANLTHSPAWRWELRSFLLAHDQAWPLLSADIRESLARVDHGGAVGVFKEWNDRLEKGTRAARFFELYLNVCDEPALSAIVPAAIGELKTLDVLPWWDCADEPGAWADLRDRFARSVPVVSWSSKSLLAVLEWLDPPQPGEVRLARREEDPSEWPFRDARSLPLLSPGGRAHWLCVEAVSKFWDLLWVPPESLPLGPLDREDGYRLLAWLIYKTDPSFQEHYPLDSLANWLIQMKLTNVDRIGDWAECLPADVEVTRERRRGREPFVAALCDVVQRQLSPGDSP